MFFTSNAASSKENKIEPETTKKSKKTDKGRPTDKALRQRNNI